MTFEETDVRCVQELRLWHENDWRKMLNTLVKWNIKSAILKSCGVLGTYISAQQAVPQMLAHTKSWGWCLWWQKVERCAIVLPVSQCVLHADSQKYFCNIKSWRSCNNTFTADWSEALSPIHLGPIVSYGAEMDVRAFEMEVDCLNLSE